MSHAPTDHDDQPERIIRGQADQDDQDDDHGIMPERWTLSPRQASRPVDPWLVNQSSTD